MNPNIFRQYDVRGVVDEDLTPGVVEDLGRAYGSAIKNSGGSKVGVGMDVRETSPPLRDALVRGILSTGIHVVRLGMVATPTVYYSVYALDLDGAVQVTGSHNPIEYNGFKMMVGKGSLYGDAIQELRKAIETQTFASGEGTVEDVDLDERYLTAITEGIHVDRPLRLVLDAGNGCASVPAPKLFKALGCEVEELFCVPDGTFPNHIPDPTLPETLDRLRERVLATGADVGMAYDGDADRLGAIDNTGRVVWGDQLLALFARSVLKERPGAEILFEVKCSRALKDDIEAHGGVGVMTKTGHSLIKKAMKETGSPLAGEMSGHMFFADRWFGFDDALYASARLAELIASWGKSLAELIDTLPAYYATPEIRIDCSDDKKFNVVEAVLGKYQETHEVSDVDGARIDFPDGWGLVRASNTQPVLVLRAEGDSESARDRIEAELRQGLRALGVTA